MIVPAYPVRLATIFLLQLTLIACGGSSNSDTATNNEVSSVGGESVEALSCDNGSSESAEIKQVGTLSGVEGLAYESETIETVNGVKKTISGVTTASGEYDYYEVCGETSETDICYIKKCITIDETATGIEIVHPDIRPGVIGKAVSSTEPKTIRDFIFSTYEDQTDTVKKRITINTYRFLMALDDDNNPNTGLRLAPQTLEQGQKRAKQIDFTREDFASDTQVIDYLKKVVDKDALATDENAKLFLQTNLAGINRFIVSGTVKGAPQPIMLQLNGTETISPSDGGRFFFNTELRTGDAYHVELLEQTPGLCHITSNTGIIADAAITNINVLCSSQPPSGGAAL